MCKVIVQFADLQDNNRLYNVGDTFPHKACSYEVSKERIAELSGCNNKLKMPLIERVEVEKPKRGRKPAEQ